MKRIFTLFTVLVVIGLAVSAHALLIDNGDGTITQQRDDGITLVWLQDANRAMTSGYDADDLMTWSQAMTWASYLVFAGYDDWRLPTFNTDNPGDRTTHEMGYLYQIDLGASGGPIPSADPFTNIQLGGNDWYWSGTEVPAGAPGLHGSVTDYSRAWVHSFGCGCWDSLSEEHYAWAVREVPEPSTLLILSSGLVGVAAWRKRLSRKEV